jgi:hypothetical protein
MPVRWCVDRATLKGLEDKGIRFPYILLVVRNSKTKWREERMLVPFEDFLKYVSFSRPGENLIHAFLIHADEGFDRTRKQVARRLEYMFVARHAGSYMTTFFDSEGKPFDHPKDLNIVALTSVSITVARELFAPEPPAWEKHWVNLWFGRTRPHNQCDYRHRRLVAYTIQPPCMFAWVILNYIVFGICALISVLLGRFDLSWGKFRPDQIGDVGEGLDLEDASWFAKKRLYLWPLTPIIPLLATMLVVLIGKLPFRLDALLAYAVLMVALAMVATLVCVAIVLAVAGTAKLADRVHTLFMNWERNEGATSKNKQEVSPPRSLPLPAYVAKASALSCDQIGPSTMAIPKEYQTIQLRFQAFKAKVCKPFAF